MDDAILDSILSVTDGALQSDDAEQVAALVTAYRALRARVAQDTPTEPAAWRTEYPSGPQFTADPVRLKVWRDQGNTIDPLYDHPAPVAAVPTEGAIDDDILAAAYGPPVPPAPSTGEDEAAVERAAHCIAGGVGVWRFAGDDDREEWREQARAVLSAAPPPAAARGPRTPDDTQDGGA